MKCENCGFISKKEFYRCPYCGEIYKTEDNVFKKSVTIGNEFSLQVKTIIYIVMLNLIGLAFMVDLYFSFAYGLTLWAAIACFGGGLVISISSRKKNLVTSVEQIDVYILLILLIACGLLRIEGVFDFRMYVPGIAIPAFLIIATIVSFIFLFRKQKEKVRPIYTELLLIFHLIISIIIFVFFLVNKYCVLNGVNNPPFAFLQYGMTKEAKTPLYMVEEILVYLSFGLTLIYLINFNIVLAGFLVRKVKNLYGGTRD